jgi:hypothetical protein
MHGQIAAFAGQPGADYVRIEADRRWFEQLPYFADQPSPWAAFTEFDKTELKQPFRWVRQFAFVKDAKPDGPCYLVIADDLTGNRELEPAFNFWCLANDVRPSGPRQYHFTGQHGVDLDMHIAEPAEGRVQLGEWGHHQGFLIGGAGLDERQKLVRVFRGPDGGGFRVVLYPRKPNEPQPKVESLAGGKLLKVTLPDQTHWIVLSREPVEVADGPVSIAGTAAVIKQLPGGRIEIVLLAAGKARHGAMELATPGPAASAP